MEFASAIEIYGDKDGKAQATVRTRAFVRRTCALLHCEHARLLPVHTSDPRAHWCSSLCTPAFLSAPGDADSPLVAAHVCCFLPLPSLHGVRRA